MVQTVVLYKKPEDTEAFDKYYFGTHIPLVQKLPGVLRAEISKFTGSPAGEAPYYLMATMYFETMAEMMAAFGTPEGRAVSKDVRNFAKAEDVTMIFGEVQS